MAREIQFVDGKALLPNGDIWRGSKRNVERPDNVERVIEPKDSTDAVVQMIAASTGENVECVWCGQEFPRKDLNAIREHVEERHFTAVNREESEKAAIMAQLKAPAAEEK